MCAVWSRELRKSGKDQSFQPAFWLSSPVTIDLHLQLMKVTVPAKSPGFFHSFSILCSMIISYIALYDPSLIIHPLLHYIFPHFIFMSLIFSLCRYFRGKMQAPYSSGRFILQMFLLYHYSCFSFVAHYTN